MSRLSKEEILANRQKLKEIGFFAYFIKPTLEDWKKRPFTNLFIFLYWAILYYLIFTSIQAINHDLIYCDCSDNRFDGKLMDVYNEYVEYENSRRPEFENRNDEDHEAEDYIFYTDFTPVEIQRLDMVCKYNLKKWTQEPTGFFRNMKKLVIERWTKDKNIK